MTVFAAARVVSGDGGMSGSPAWVAVADGRITATGTGAAPHDAIDLGDALLAPGFVDLQVNGTGDTDFASASVDDIVSACDALIDGGCTTVLPTLCSAPLDQYDEMLSRLANAREKVHGILGVHLEGPFLGGAPGAHPRELVRPVDLAWLEALLEGHADLVRLLTLAPEADPDGRAIATCMARGVTVALGHSTASYDDAQIAADRGARIVTHLFNGMGAFHHREPGLIGAAFDDRRLVPTIIADLVHVHPVALRLAIAARPDIAVVTDAIAGPQSMPDGTLAGSKISMADALANLHTIGVAVGQAVRMVTGNPARALGISDRGRIAPGVRADLVALDPESLTPRAVWQGGDRRDL